MKLYKMRSRFAIPLIKDTLCPHMEYFEHFAIIDVECNAIANERLITSHPLDLELLPEWLSENGVTDIITREIGDHLFKLLIKQNIKIHIGPELKKPVDLVIDWLQNSLIIKNNTSDHNK